jgi:hypothetical protein
VAEGNKTTKKLINNVNAHTTREHAQTNLAITDARQKVTDVGDDVKQIHEVVTKIMSALSNENNTAPKAVEAFAVVSKRQEGRHCAGKGKARCCHRHAVDEPPSTCFPGLRRSGRKSGSFRETDERPVERVS